MWILEWKQELYNEKFYEQIEWEHEHIVECDILFVYFQSDTKSPISLMELGLATGLGIETVVCCPKGFWRKGNVDYICKKYNIDQVDSLDDFVNYLNKFKNIKENK